MIKRFSALLALVAIVISACSSGSGTATTAPTTAATSAPSEAATAAPSEAASQPAAGAASLVIWADEKRAKAIKPLAEQWADRQRRHGHRRGHRLGHPDQVQDREPGRNRAGHRRLGA